jgi:hypothetical protein
VDNRSDIQLNHGELAGQFNPVKLAVGAEPGVVHEQLDGESPLPGEFEDSLWRGSSFEVCDTNFNANTMPAAELPGELLEPLLATRGKDEVCAARSELLGERPANARTCPGH